MCTWGPWSCPDFNVTGIRIGSASSECFQLGDRKHLKLHVGQMVGRRVLARSCCSGLFFVKREVFIVIWCATQSLACAVDVLFA